MNRHFLADCHQRLDEAYSAGRIDRRSLLKAAALLGIAPLALRPDPAKAASPALVFVNWGGDVMKAYDAAYIKSFTKATGIAVKQDGGGATEGGITAQFKSGKPTWDVVDADPFSANTLGPQGMLEPIDYTIVDKAKTRPGMAWEYEVSAYFYSYVIAYDAKKYGDKTPTGMADFFDVKKFPGKRALYKWASGMWEAALLADGVPKDKLYPLDLERAHAKIRAFKDNVSIYWGSGAESQNALLSGDASMALIWSPRASLLEKDTNGRIKYLWDDGILSPGGMAVIKNNPAGREAAMKYIAAMQEPSSQLIMFEMMGQGPGNPATDALIPADKKRYNCIDPVNAAKQVLLDMDWYTKHYSSAFDAYTKIISA